MEKLDCLVGTDKLDKVLGTKLLKEWLKELRHFLVEGWLSYSTIAIFKHVKGCYVKEKFVLVYVTPRGSSKFSGRQSLQILS